MWLFRSMCRRQDLISDMRGGRVGFTLSCCFQPRLEISQKIPQNNRYSELDILNVKDCRESHVGTLDREA